MVSPCPRCGGTKIHYMACVDKLKCFTCGYKLGGRTTRDTYAKWQAAYKLSQENKDKQNKA